MSEALLTGGRCKCSEYNKRTRTAGSDPIWQPITISSDQGTHFTAHNVQQEAERDSHQSSSLIENWDGLLQDWL